MSRLVLLYSSIMLLCINAQSLAQRTGGITTTCGLTIQDLWFERDALIVELTPYIGLRAALQPEFDRLDSEEQQLFNSVGCSDLDCFLTIADFGQRAQLGDIHSQRYALFELLVAELTDPIVTDALTFYVSLRPCLPRTGRTPQGIRHRRSDIQEPKLTPQQCADLLDLEIAHRRIAGRAGAAVIRRLDDVSDAIDDLVNPAGNTDTERLNNTFNAAARILRHAGSASMEANRVYNAIRMAEYYADLYDAGCVT